MAQIAFADNVEIFRIETDGDRIAGVTATGEIKGVLGQPILFGVFEEVQEMEITGLPVSLSGDVPQKVSFGLTINAGDLPDSPLDIEIEFSVMDADDPLEAELFINTEFVDHLWPGGNSRDNEIVSLQRIQIPGRFLVLGENPIEIELRKSGDGFTILADPAPLISVLLSSKNPAVSPLFDQAADAFQKLSLEL